MEFIPSSSSASSHEVAAGGSPAPGDIQTNRKLDIIIIRRAGVPRTDLQAGVLLKLQRGAGEPPSMSAERSWRNDHSQERAGTPAATAGKKPLQTGNRFRKERT
jgi:hypothetical protein